MKKIAAIGMLSSLCFFITSCMPSSDDHAESDNDLPPIPMLYLEYDADHLPILRLADAIEGASKRFKTKNITISDIQISEVNSEQGADSRGWVVLNWDDEKCSPALPPIVKYGQKLPACMKVKRSDTYNRKKEYIFTVNAIADTIPFEFLIVTDAPHKLSSSVPMQ